MKNLKLWEGLNWLFMALAGIGTIGGGIAMVKLQELQIEEALNEREK